MHTKRLRKFIKDLNHEDSSERRASAEALSEGDERAVYPLIKALRDDNFGVQDSAMRSLMSIKSESTAYMVLPLLRGNAFLRNTAIMIIREVGKEAVPLLEPLLKDQDDDVRKFALDLIHDIRHCDYPEALVDMLKNDPNPNVRAAAAKTIGSLDYKEAIPELMESLKIKVDEEWVCFSAIEALTNLGDDRSVQSIVALLNSPSEAIRYASIEALGNLGSPLAIKPLVDHMPGIEGFEKNAVIKSLVQIGNIPSIPGMSESLIEMLKEGEWDDKHIAIKGLVAIDEKSAIHHMIDLAGSFDTSVPDSEDKVYIIKEAVESFGCNDNLLNTLTDDSLKFRGKSIAIDITGNLRCKKAVPTLIKLLKNAYRDVQRSIVNSLGKIGSKEASQCLIDSISEHDSHVRKNAIISLGQIGEKAAFEPLMKFLHSEKYNDVIYEFIKTLLSIDSSNFLSRIDEFSDEIKEIIERYASEINPEVSC